MDRLSRTPNVLLTYIAEVYLHAPLTVIPLALTSHHLYRVLRSYRHTHPVTYYVHPRTHSVHIVNENPYDQSFSLDRASVAHWKSIHPSITREMKSKGTKKAKQKKKQSKPQFITHAQKAGDVTKTAIAEELEDQKEEHEAMSSAASVIDEAPPQLAAFTPGRIGVCIPRHIILDRVYHPRFFECDYITEQHHLADEQNMGDLYWVPPECRTLLIKHHTHIPSGMMTQLTQVERIEFEYLHCTAVTHGARYYPPNLRALIIKNCDPDGNLPLPFPISLTEIILPQRALRAKPYDVDPNFIPWPTGLVKLNYSGQIHPVVGWKLPDSITDLTLGKDFNHPVSGWTPPRNLTRLKFHHEFNQTLAEINWHESSVGLIELELRGFRMPLNKQKLPPTLKRLKLLVTDAEYHVNEFVLLPQLEELILSGEWRCDLKQVKLPPTLTRLQFLGDVNQSLEGLTFPASLTELLFSDKFSGNSVEGQHLVLNDGLKHLNFGQQFDEPVASLRLPSTLQSLTFGMQFNRDIFSLRFPAGLRTLTFGNRFSRSLRGFTLPSSLTHLALSSSFNQTLRGVVLPSSLREFHLRSHVFQPLDSLIELFLPETLEHITVPHPKDSAFSPFHEIYVAYVDAFPSSIQVQLWSKALN